MSDKWFELSEQRFLELKEMGLPVKMVYVIQDKYVKTLTDIFGGATEEQEFVSGIPIIDVDFNANISNSRIAKTLTSAGIHTLRQSSQLTDTNLLKRQNVGRYIVHKLREAERRLLPSQDVEPVSEVTETVDTYWRVKNN
jgi:hypothetical protein